MVKLDFNATFNNKLFVLRYDTVHALHVTFILSSVFGFSPLTILVLPGQEARLGIFLFTTKIIIFF